MLYKKSIRTEENRNQINRFVCTSLCKEDQKTLNLMVTTESLKYSQEVISP